MSVLILSKVLPWQGKEMSVLASTIASGPRHQMLALEKGLHESMPLGPEERQIIYFAIQWLKGYNP